MNLILVREKVSSGHLRKRNSIHHQTYTSACWSNKDPQWVFSKAKQNKFNDWSTRQLSKLQDIHSFIFRLLNIWTKWIWNWSQFCCFQKVGPRNQLNRISTILHFDMMKRLWGCLGPWGGQNTREKTGSLSMLTKHLAEATTNSDRFRWILFTWCWAANPHSHLFYIGKWDCFAFMV